MIKMLKLVSGEEIIADISKNDDGSFTISNPITFVNQQTEDGVKITPVPWVMFSNDRTFTLTQSAVILEPADPVQEIIDMYSAKFGGLVLPKKDIATS